MTGHLSATRHTMTYNPTLKLSEIDTRYRIPAYCCGKISFLMARRAVQNQARPCFPLPWKSKAIFNFARQPRIITIFEASALISIRPIISTKFLSLEIPFQISPIPSKVSCGVNSDSSSFGIPISRRASRTGAHQPST